MGPLMKISSVRCKPMLKVSEQTVGLFYIIPYKRTWAVVCRQPVGNDIIYKVLDRKYKAEKIMHELNALLLRWEIE